MDPDANLAEQRRIVERYNHDEAFDAEDAERLVDLVEALDAWISKGGFLPHAWGKGRKLTFQKG